MDLIKSPGPQREPDDNASSRTDRIEVLTSLALPKLSFLSEKGYKTL